MFRKAFSVFSLVLVVIGPVLSGCTKTRTEVLKPSGPIVQVPPAVIFRGEPEPGTQRSGRRTPGKGFTLSAGKISPQQIAKAEEALSKRPRDPKTQNDAGCIMAAAGNVERGVELLEQAHRSAPNDPTITYNYARALYQQGQTDQAIRLTDEALSRQPDFEEAHVLAASAAIQNQDYAGAEQQVQRIPADSALRAQVLIILGVIQLARGKVDDAIKIFLQLLNADPDNPVGLYDLGVAHQQANNLAEAEKCYRDAMAKDPDLPEAHHNLGTLLAQRGDRQKAFEEFHAATLQRPDNKVFAEHLSQAAREERESKDKIAGEWVSEGGSIRMWGHINGQPQSQEMAMPAGSRVTIVKVAEGTYRWDESLMGKTFSITIHRQGNGSYQGPAASLPDLLPPGVTSEGTVTFWVRGDTLMGTTRESARGATGSFEAVKSWKAKRARG